MFEKKYPFKIGDEYDTLNIVIIGLGGTGSNFAPDYSMLVSNIEDRNIRTTFVDKDIVEVGNLNRQYFFRQTDLGKVKSEVMANRYLRMGLEIKTVPRYIKSDRDLIKLLSKKQNAFNIVISLVDNVSTRKTIYNVFNEGTNKFFWIDSGNKQYNGQVIGGYNGDCNLSEDDLSMFKLPSVMDIHPEFLEIDDSHKIEDRGQSACTNNAIREIQNIGINKKAANITFDFLNNLISKEGLLFYYVTFDSQLCTSYTEFITLTNVNRRVK